MKDTNFKILRFFLIISIVSLMIISIIIVFSASVRISEILEKNWYSLGIKHVIKVILSGLILYLASIVPYRLYKDKTRLGIITVIILLILTLIFGVEKNGSVRSLNLYLVEIQPSILGIYALIFHLASLIVSKGEKVKNFVTGYFPMLIWTSMVAILVMAQPNFSTTIITVSIGLTMMFLGGTKLKHIMWTILAFSPILIVYALIEPYRLERILGYMSRLVNPTLTDPVPQVRYAIYAIGSGGVFGIGVGRSRFRELFIPESYSDFIFSIIGEEFGFFGSVVILFFYSIILYVGFKIVKNVNDEFGKLIAAGITILIGIYVILNIYVVVGFLPVTGLPLPFLSYGGTALLAHSFGIGVLINISKGISSENSFTPKIVFNNEKQS